MPDEKNVLVCNRVEPDDMPVIAGTKQIACAACGHAVWASPSGRRMIDDLGLDALCVVCALEVMDAEEDEVKIMPPSEDQIQELKAALSTIKNQGRDN